MANFIRNVGDHPSAGSSATFGVMGKYDVTGTGTDSRIASKAPDRLMKGKLKPDAFYNDGKGDPGPNFGKIPHLRGWNGFS